MRIGMTILLIIATFYIEGCRKRIRAEDHTGKGLSGKCNHRKAWPPGLLKARPKVNKRKTMKVDLLEVIKSRRSIRRFHSDRPIADALLKELLDAMRWAPSAGNVQPWRVHVIKKAETRLQLKRAALGQGFIAQAPVALVITVHLPEAGRNYGARGQSLYCYQDTAASIQNLLLLAHYRGLGTCWVGAFNEMEVVRIIGLPKNQRPVAIIPVGYPAIAPKAPSRRPLKELVIHH